MPTFICGRIRRKDQYGTPLWPRVAGRARRRPRYQRAMGNHTMIAAVGRNGPQAPWVLDGPIDGCAFAAWAQHALAPTLEPGDIVILDNLAAHRNPQARQAIEARGATVWFLPPYSPDLNPIEKMWSRIRALLRKAKARDPEALFKAIGRAFNAVSHTYISNWFASCGYSFI